MVGKDESSLTAAKGSLLVTVFSNHPALFILLILGVSKVRVGLRIVQDEEGWVWGLKKRT